VAGAMEKKDTAKTVLAEEQRLLAWYNRLLAEGVEPELGSLLMRMIGTGIQHCGELEKFVGGDQATAEITKQINDMFL